MPRGKAATKSAVESDATTNVASDNSSVDEVKNTRETKKIEPLRDSDEIEVVSLISNVSYKDNRTNDMYEWDEVGHTELMTVETIKNMWRNHKGYFRNLWLKPMDDRIINQFGLTKTYEKYEYLMDESNYTRDKINEVIASIDATPNGLKFAICNKIKDLVVSGDVADVTVIKALEKHLDIDLISFI